MPLSYEQRHLPDILAFHRHACGGGGMFIPSVDFLLLESDPGTGVDKLLLESDPGTETDALLLESST
jgi:hypothetical protein